MRRVIGLTPLAIHTIIDFLRQNLRTDEPVDAFSVCNLSKLHASLAAPFQRPKKASFSDTLFEKTALTFFLLIENHILPTNGNKRLATMGLLLMLSINGYELNVSQNELYQLAIKVTEMCRAREKQVKTLETIHTFLKEHSHENDKPETQLHVAFEKDFDEYLELLSQ